LFLRSIQFPILTRHRPTKKFSRWDRKLSRQLRDSWFDVKCSRYMYTFTICRAGQ